MSTSLSRSCLALGVAVWACCALMSWADSYPSKPVRVIVPFPPGSGVDILARSFTPKFAETTGQQFIVDNRGGAAGNIGAGAAAKAPSDGYTLLIAPASLVSSQAMYKDLPFDLARDFDAIAFLATSPMILLVNPNVPAKSPKELIALAKSKPGQLNYGSSGVGGSGHLSVELFRRMAGIELVHVPYKGNATAFADLLGGHLSIMFTGIVSSLSLVKAGQLRAQDAKYTLTPDGDKTKLRFDLSVDLAVPLPGFVVKRTIKGAMETATDGLRKQVLKVKKGG